MSEDKNLPSCSSKINTTESPDNPVQTMNDNASEETPIRTPNRGIRTTLTLFQMERLEDEFRRKNIIDKRTRFHLSNSIGLDEKYIKFWFQGRRRVQVKSWLKMGLAYMRLQSIQTNLHEALESTTSLDDLSRNLSEIDLNDYVFEEENEGIFVESNTLSQNFEQSEDFQEVNFQNPFVVDGIYQQNPFNENQEVDDRNLYAADDSMEFWDSITLPKDFSTNIEDLVSTLPRTEIKEASCAELFANFHDHPNQEETDVENSFTLNETTEYWDALSSPNASSTCKNDYVNVSPQRNNNIIWSNSSPISYTTFRQSVPYDICQSYDQESVVHNSFNNTLEYWDPLSSPNVSYTNPENLVNLTQTHSPLPSVLKSNNNNQEFFDVSVDNDDTMDFWDSISSPNPSNLNPDDLVSTLPLINDTNTMISVSKSPARSRTTSKRKVKQPKLNKNNNKQNHRESVDLSLYHNDDTMEFWDSLLARTIESKRSAEELVSTLPEMDEDLDDFEETNNVVAKKSGKAPNLSGYQRYMLEKMYRGLKYINRTTRRNLTSLIGLTMKQFRSWLSWRKKKHGMLLQRYNEYGVDPIPAQFKPPESNENHLELLNQNVVYVQDLDDFVDLSHNENPEVFNNLDGLLQGIN